MAKISTLLTEMLVLVLTTAAGALTLVAPFTFANGGQELRCVAVCKIVSSGLHVRGAINVLGPSPDLTLITVVPAIRQRLHDP